MHKVDGQKYIALLLCISTMGNITYSSVLDRDLDPHRAVVLVEKEVRSLEKDLNGDGEYIPEEDILLLSVMVRQHLNMFPHNVLRSNPMFVRAEEGKVLIQFVEKRAGQHARTITDDMHEITNAQKIESNEFMNLLRAYPDRKGKNLYPYFGTTFKQRVKANTMNGKYHY